VGPAGEISFFHSDVVQHLLDDGDVLGLATVRRAGDSELFVTPAQRIESAGAEKWNYLERFGAGSPVGKRIGIACRSNKLVTFADHCRVYTMLRFGAFTASDNYIELVRVDHIPPTVVGVLE
jgi:hypothetical protein